MTEQGSSQSPEAERLALLRDPPAPPGYVDPLESSPLLEDGPKAEGRSTPRRERVEVATVDLETRNHS